MNPSPAEEAFGRWRQAVLESLASPERVLAWQDRRYQFAHQVGQLLTGPPPGGAAPVVGHVVYGVYVAGAGLLYVGQTGDARRRLRDLPVGESHHLATTVPPETWERVLVVQWPTLLSSAPGPEARAAEELGHETCGLALEHLLQVTYRPVMTARRRSGAGEWTARHIDFSRSRGAVHCGQFPGLFQVVRAVWDELARTPVLAGGHLAVYVGAGRVIFPALLVEAPKANGEGSLCGSRGWASCRAGVGMRSSRLGPRLGAEVTAPFATRLLGWKPSKKNKLGWPLVPNFADVDNAESLRIAAAVLDVLGVPRGMASEVPADPGGPLEQAVCDHLADTLPTRHPDRSWQVSRGKVITGFDQYAHLSEVHALVRANPELRITIGMDYLIRPDVTVGLAGVPTASGLPPLHAAVSCKWTIRSDRVQNIRHECLQMIRHRRGRQPHLVTVTAEPLPSRLASIARGTGEVDAVYHIAFDALDASVAEHANAEQAEAWREVTGQRRVLSYELLIGTLASW